MKNQGSRYFDGINNYLSIKDTLDQVTKANNIHTGLLLLLARSLSSTSI